MEDPCLLEKRKQEVNFMVKRFLKKLFWSLLVIVALPFQIMFDIPGWLFLVFIIDMFIIWRLATNLLLVLNTISFMK